MARILRSSLVALLASLALSGTAQAAGGNYVFAGGSEEAQAQVRAALDASRFDWDVVPQQITIQIGNCGCAGARPGVVVLDEAQLVDSPHGERYAWAIVQHEYAHQIDFLLLGDLDRKKARRLLGGKDWCYEKAGLGHDDHGCERFATMVAWSYWRSPDNIQRPDWKGRHMRPAAFRKLVKTLVSTPVTSAAS